MSTEQRTISENVINKVNNNLKLFIRKIVKRSAFREKLPDQTICIFISRLFQTFSSAAPYH